jgi:tetrapyrrole methylase family protein / MazG family protein
MNFQEKRPLYLLMEIASILRSENGCAWDREQTSGTLKPYLIEEAYELYDAIEKHDPAAIKEELGDLLYQVYAHSQIASEQDEFTIDDVASGIAAKLIHRHPHVFGNETVLSADEVSDRWEKIKKKEKSDRQSILDGVPAHLPALLKAYRVQQKVSRIGFDWEKIDDAALKLDEELDEFKEALAQKDKEKMTEEAGDIFFSMVNVLRFMKINPEEALRKSVDKFMGRFREVEKLAAAKGENIDEMTLPELEELWEQAKML